MSTTSLTALLPSTTYSLIYSLPLLLISLTLNYAGAFLTLDRTRTFAPRNDAIDVGTMPGVAFDYNPRKKKFYWLLEGGLGGIGIGYAFGVHCATFLSLLIPSVSTSAPLTNKSFLAVWLISVILLMALAGRWRYAAIILSGITGGATLALSLSVILHPSLLARIVLVAVFVPILTVLSLLPISRLQHGCIRLCASSAGAFGTVLSIAILAKVSAWANVWERLWISDGSDWGTTQEKGLSAGFCLFLCTGLLCDWFLHSKLGENPDQKWDSLLANYTNNLPNFANRAGNFRPLSSFWSGLFGDGKSKHEVIYTSPDAMVFPPDDKHGPPMFSSPPGKLHRHPTAEPNDTPESGPFEYTKRPAYLRKGPSIPRYKNLGTKRDVVKFQPLDPDEELSSDDSDDDSELKTPRSPPRPNGFVLKQPSSLGSATTAVDIHREGSDPLDFEKEKARLAGIKASLARKSNDGEALEYSDYEEDVTAHPRQRPRDTPGWSPEFLRRHRSATGAGTPESRNSGSGGGQDYFGNAAVSSSAGSQHTAVDGNLTAASPPPGAVPMTPSLIKAFDRIHAAQREAFSAPTTPVSQPSVPPHRRQPPAGQNWDVFWKDVTDKATEGLR
ncbi:hypothetical protein JAAARDRAFT_170470 [Jaapia argillacea MUCL 33604]|uniref:DUF4203 domain-containing protein n=1 Tax=Jaapia argillacea MUCL 33604 TaxID=933084 RepID=A0A067Q5H8_9AGAM|nr:hypothetical protein JAAARDRAFT_170470 [Jaapia argillacea MUCL 33604]